MPLRAEQIMMAVESTLTGLTTTGANVFRGRVHGLEATEVPALALYQGVDTPLGEEGFSNLAYLDSELLVKVTAHVKSSSQTETILNKIRREVHVALMADYTQGLSFVLQTLPRGTAEPLLLGGGETPTASMDMYWGIQYRSSISDPGA